MRAGSSRSMRPIDTDAPSALTGLHWASACRGLFAKRGFGLGVPKAELGNEGWRK